MYFMMKFRVYGFNLFHIHAGLLLLCLSVSYITHVSIASYISTLLPFVITVLAEILKLKSPDQQLFSNSVYSGLSPEHLNNLLKPVEA